MTGPGPPDLMLLSFWMIECVVVSACNTTESWAFLFSPVPNLVRGVCSRDCRTALFRQYEAVQGCEHHGGNQSPFPIQGLRKIGRVQKVSESAEDQKGLKLALRTLLYSKMSSKFRPPVTAILGRRQEFRIPDHRRIDSA